MGLIKFDSVKSLAIIIAIISAVITVVFQIIIIGQDNILAWKIIVSSSLGAFVIIFVVVYYLIKSLLKKRIKPIYNTINKLNEKSLDVDNDFNDVDIISAAEKDVEIWANNKTQEIAQLKHMEKYRKEFLGDVFHELKTPIFNIQGYISTLLDGGLEDKTINRRFLENADKSIDRMISIVEDLNSISNLESGELKINITKFDIVRLIKEVVELQHNRALKKEINLILNQTKEIFVKADQKLIMQVLTNLITNSINYGKKNGETIINIDVNSEYVLVEVKDNGIGIEQENLSRLFERFYRVDKSRSKDSGGTGLGLSICKHIIEAHKQSIYVNSLMGKETSFTFSIEK